ncbi:hypothetical protein BJY24_006283 [Nocardia transvalensis]|uniref:Linalool dehydratase/isomerase domain-containing protein n=1 Tax=Nocardia transvalensis TaxID=37333 RepID=A0A7W9ULB2_9NOCA|nr:hypothetical protein [Nocardia transvalensis]MBB5917371.1 hypothetical protein [Nocardia transvalensis]
MTTLEDRVRAVRLRGPSTARWFARTVTVAVVVWVIAAAVPAVFGLSPSWRAFGAGLIVPGAGLLVAVPPLHHPFGTAMVAGHAVLIAAEILLAGWALRRFRAAAGLGVVALGALLAVGISAAPAAVVVTGHALAFAGVLAAAGWAYMFRCIARSDYVTLPAIMIASAAAGAALAAYHGGMAGPLAWFSWAALAIALAATGFGMVRELIRHRAAGRVGAERAEFLDRQRAVAYTNPVPLRQTRGVPVVSEATPDQLAHVRHLLSIAMQPPGEWDGFDDEGPGPLQQYRYQLNSLGWALSMYTYSHTPALRGPLHAAQVNLFDRMRDPAVWGYWYWENLLGNWDFGQRRGDPIDVPQNIMFTGYLNLQLGLFEQATGDYRYRAPGAFEFRSARTRPVSYDRDAINAIVVRNFGGELCLWACEPLPIGRGRTRGLVFPYCNAVAAAGVAVSDALHGTGHAAEIAPRLHRALDAEFTAADGDIVTFLVSGLGLTARAFRGPTTTAGISAFLTPLLPDLGRRAWEILRKEWLETGRYLESGSAGTESPTAEDWGSRAATNAEALAGAMLLAQELGDREWHAELWRAATEQLGFADSETRPGVKDFRAASVHANGMLGLGGLGRPFALTDMMSTARPPAWNSGPRLAEVPHPDVTVARAVSDGTGLDAVLRPGLRPGRFALVLDRLRPGRTYAAHGTPEGFLRADENGVARLVVDLYDRTAIEVRLE